MEILYAKPLVKQLEKKLLLKAENLINRHKINPTLAIICLNKAKENDCYNKNIKKKAQQLKINIELFNYFLKSFLEIKNLLDELNKNSKIHGIIINQPIDKIYENLTEIIKPEKDIEGIGSQNFGKLILQKPSYIPCTAMAIIELLRCYKINLIGSHVCILGRSLIIGKPISIILTNENATITLCHSKTTNVESYTKKADIVISAIGKARFIKSSWLKKNAVVIDVGTNYENNKLIGDVDFEQVKKHVSKISPVPGGVGSLTTLMLMKNCLRSFEQSFI